MVLPLLFVLVDKIVTLQPPSHKKEDRDELKNG
jgi:hypothetical protein